MLVSNVSSWKRHGLTVVDTYLPDLLVATETRLALDLWPAQQVALQRRGYNALCTPPRVQDNGMPHGGVLLAARQPARLAPLLPPTDWQQRWPGRLLMAYFYPPNAKEHIIVLAIYAPFAAREDPEAWALNRTFLQEVFELAATFGSAQVLVMGDYNRADEDPLMTTVLTSGRWHNALTVHGQARAPTTLGAPVSSHQPIDHILCSSGILRHLHQGLRAPEPVGDHYPLLLTLKWPAGHRTLTLRDPSPLPPEAHRPMARESAPTWTWSLYAEELADALHRSDTLHATIWWMKRWEGLLVERVHDAHGTVTTAQLGRGQFLGPTLRRRAHTRPHAEMMDTTTHQLRRLRNLLIEQERCWLHDQALPPRQARIMHNLLNQCSHILPPSELR